jgi:hypothetical protein
VRTCRKKRGKIQRETAEKILIETTGNIELSSCENTERKSFKKNIVKKNSKSDKRVL